MKRHGLGVVNKARNLIQNTNLSISQIAKKLGVNDGSVSSWCRGIPSLSSSKSFHSIIKNQDNRNKITNSEKKIIQGISLSKRYMKLYSAILYGCEGSKYPSSNCVTLTNSDPKMIKCFVECSENGFSLDHCGWKVHLQIHSDQNALKITEFWSSLLNIPKENFYKPTISVAGGNRYRNNYYGTCSVKYYDYQVQLKLIGIFEQFMRKSICFLEGMPSG